MRYTRYLFFLLCGLFFSADIYAQSWQWGRGAGGNGTDGWPVATDPSGNVFYAAVNFSGAPVTFGTYTVPNITMEYQCVLAKYDGSGNFLWALGTQNGAANLVNIATDHSGNVFLFGAITGSSLQIGSFTLTNSFYPAVSQYFLAKIDPSGNVLWARNDGQNQGSFFSVYLMYGMTRICGTGAIATDAAGNAFITSNFSSPTVTIGAYTLTNTDPSGSTDDILIAKYDPSGTLVWAKSAGGSKKDDAYGITVTPAGDVYIAGVFSSPSVTFGPSVITNSSDSLNAFIARYNASGTPVWAAGSGGSGGEYAAGLGSDAANNVYMTGGLDDNSISFSGTTITNPYSGKPVLYLVKFDPSNNVTWHKTIGSATGSAWGYCVATSVCGEIWVSGAMDHDINIDGHVLTNSSTEPVFIAGYSSAGTVAGYASLNSGGDDQTGMACDAFGNVYLCSDYQGISFPVGPDTLGNLTFAYELMYVGKYTATTISSPDTIYKHQDTTICLSTSVLLTAPAGYTGYIWDNGSTGSTRGITASGKYWVIGLGTCNTATIIDTFNVTTIKMDTIYKHTDTAICLNATLLLSAPAGYNPYLWNNGNTTQTNLITAPGTYWVVGTGTCTTPTLIDTFKVLQKNIDITFSLGKDTSVCTPLILTVPVTSATYLWQDGSTANTYTATRGGAYFVTITKQGCSYSDTINLNVLDLSQHLHDTTLCSELHTVITLSANVPNGATALWSTGSAQNSITVQDTGRYWVSVTDGSCAGSDTMTLKSELCDCELSLPNAFTPNDDGINDYFHPLIEKGCMIIDYTFAIYNRWGEQVFLTNDLNARWNGKYKEIRVEIGTYMYMMEYKAGYNNNHHFKKGDVTVIR